MAEQEILTAEEVSSDEFYSEWIKAIRRELSVTVGRGLEPSEWVKFVRYEVNSCLDRFFPVIKSGNVGLKYSHPVKAKYETHTEYDTTKANGVSINLVFEFDKVVDIPKEAN